jgi:hypothetical protein
VRSSTGAGERVEICKKDGTSPDYVSLIAL